jgi:hypothetical protein
MMSRIITETERAEILSRQTPQPRSVAIRIQTFEELIQFANMAAKSNMVPKDFVGKPENIMLAVQMGSELGLAPMQALQDIAIVNGRPSVWGDAMIGLCRQSGHCKDIREWFEGDGDGMTAVCEATRVGSDPVVRRFSVDDAKRAGLWKTTPKTTKQGRDGPYEVDSGPWYAYPKRMLQMRARGFAVRDAFPDVLRGLISAEEAADIPRDTFSGTTIEATAAESMPPPPTTTNPDEPVPPHNKAPKPPTMGQWLDEIDAAVFDAKRQPDPRAALDKVLGREDVKRAEDALAAGKIKNGLKDRFKRILADARAAFASTEEPLADDFPGDS